MFRIGGINKMRNVASRRGIVRFYVRDAGGCFSSTKITFMPSEVGQVLVGGDLLFANFRGFILNIKKPQNIRLNSINFQTVKVVS